MPRHVPLVGKLVVIGFEKVNEFIIEFIIGSSIKYIHDSIYNEKRSLARLICALTIDY